MDCARRHWRCGIGWGWTIKIINVIASYEMYTHKLGLSSRKVNLLTERKGISPREWLHKKVSEIISLTDENYIEDDNELLLPSYEKGPWTVLKLISLKYILSIYTNIIGTKRFFKKMVYIDFLAGPGLNKIDRRINMLGSPFIAALAPKPFTKMIFIEKSPSTTLRASAL